MWRTCPVSFVTGESGSFPNPIMCLSATIRGTALQAKSTPWVLSWLWVAGQSIHFLQRKDTWIMWQSKKVNLNTNVQKVRWIRINCYPFKSPRAAAWTAWNLLDWVVGRKKQGQGPWTYELFFNKYIRDHHIHLEEMSHVWERDKAGSNWRRELLWATRPQGKPLALKFITCAHVGLLFALPLGTWSVTSLDLCKNLVSLVYSTVLPCTVLARSLFSSTCLQSKGKLQSPGFMVSTDRSQALEVIWTQFSDKIFF